MKITDSTISACYDAVNRYGLDIQTIICIEECSELIKAITKLKRYPNEPERKLNLADEMADVIIMIKELELGYNLEALVDEKIRFKTARLQERLYGGYGIAGMSHDPGQLQR